MRGFLKLPIAFLSLSLFLSAWIAFPVSAQDIFWSTPVKISQSTNYAIAPVVTTDSNGYVYSVWMEEPPEGYLRPSPGIFYSFWNGDTWSTPQRINNAQGWAETPSITVTSNNNLHVVWAEDSTSECEGCSQIYYSSYNGSSWSSPVSISSSLHQTNTSWEFAPKITSDSANNLYVLFTGGDESTVGSFLYYTKYNGSSWSTPVDISQGLHDVAFADLAVDTSNNIHALLWDSCNGCYQKGGIYYTFFNGSTWSTATKISVAQGDNDWSMFPRLLIDGSGALHAAWYNFNWQTREIKAEYVRKPSGGVWSSPFAVSTTVASAYWWAPLIGLTVDSSNNAFVGWGQYNSTYYQNTYCTPDPANPDCGPANNWCGCGDYGVDAMYRKYTPSTDTWSSPNLIRSTKYLDTPTIWRDKWWNQHFVWSEMNPSTNQWEFWYSEVPANSAFYNPSSQLTITMAVTNDTLKIPNNALATTATISAQVGPVPASANPLVTTLPRSYTFRPHNTTFINNKSATATISYSDAELIGSDERNLKVYFWDATLNSGAGGWSSESFSQGTNTNTNKLTATLPHFSLYGIQAPQIETRFQSPSAEVAGAEIPISYQLINLATGQPADPPAERTLIDENDNLVPFWDEYKAKLIDNQGNIVGELSFQPDNTGSLTYDANQNTYLGTFSDASFPEGNYTIETYLATIRVGSLNFHFTPQLPLTVSFQPPLRSEEIYTLQDGSTLPFKFKLFDQNGNLLTDQKEVTVLISGTDNNFSQPFVPIFDAQESQYRVMLHTKDLGMSIGHYQGQVISGSETLTENTVNFAVLDQGRVKGNATP